MTGRPYLLAAAALAAAPLFVAPGPGVAAAEESPRGSLCAANEVVIFHCSVGRKLVSVCGGRRPAPHAQYRFGAPGNIEMASPPGSLTWARTGYSGGGELQIRFRNAGHDYAVYSRTVRTRFTPDGRHDPAFQDGVMVIRDGRRISNRRCRNEARSDGQVEDFVPEGSYLEWAG